MLYRGKYADGIEDPGQPIGNWVKAIKQFGVGSEFSRGDRFIYFLTAAISIAFFGAFIWALIIHTTLGTDEDWGATVWWGFLLVGAIKAIVVTVWFLIGGTRDITRLLKDLSQAVRDSHDDGFVEKSKD